ILARRSLGPLLLPKTLMGNAYRLGGHLADLAPAATLFTPSDAHVDRDGNDKPMHTVALDANRLCKHPIETTSGSRDIILWRIAGGTRERGARHSNSERRAPATANHSDLPPPPRPRPTPEPANSFVKSFCEFTALVTSTLSPTVFPSWDRRRPDQTCTPVLVRQRDYSEAQRGVGYTAEAATSVEKSEEGGAEGGVRGRWIYGAAERGDSCRFRAALVQNAPVELQPTTHK
ncbi:hypothetical protein ALC56_08560, partial [Trachymyrmex septentrionalis]